MIRYRFSSFIIYYMAFVMGCVAFCSKSSAQSAIERIRPEYRPLAELFSTTPANEPTCGNNVQVIHTGLEKLDLLAVDMMEAKDYIHMEYFEFFRDPGSRLVRLAMNLRAEDSLQVRYIVEDFMDIFKSPNYFGSMKRHGVDVGHYSIFRLNSRNHQKVVVIDGKIGYTGGMNIGDHYFYQWRDTHLRLTGPCVKSLDSHFNEMWNSTGGKSKNDANPLEEKGIGEMSPTQLTNADADPDYSSEGAVVQIVADHPSEGHLIMNGYIWLLENCKDYIMIHTPYFTPTREIRTALRDAVERGVEVILVIPGKTDMAIVDPANRSFYKECLEDGITLYETHGKFDHSKIFVCDDYICSVGSANLDGRSLKINHEINTYLYDEDLASQIKERIMSVIGDADRVTMETVNSWSAGKKFVNRLARIIAPQL